MVSIHCFSEIVNPKIDRIGLEKVRNPIIPKLLVSASFNQIDLNGVDMHQTHVGHARKSLDMKCEMSQRRAVLDTREAAKYLGVSYSSLTKWRLIGFGPKFCRAGRRRIVYRRLDLDKFLDDNAHESTSEYAEV